MLAAKTISSTSATIRMLNTCIETCVDGEKGFAAAAAEVRDPTLKALFHQYATQRGAFVLALEDAMEQLGGVPGSHGTLKGTLHRRYAGARMAIEGRSDAVILGECERGELAAVAAYDRAFAKVHLETLPPRILQIVIEQRATIRGAYDALTHEDIRRRCQLH